jgi:hypothetical protein
MSIQHDARLAAVCLPSTRAIDRALTSALPPAGQVRAHVETQIGLVARGAAQREAVVAHTLAQFKAKVGQALHGGRGRGGVLRMLGPCRDRSDH